MSDMRDAITPKSDQWNFDDFQAGPMTFTIESVKIKGGQEQPVDIALVGTPKFYRPCKSMSRCLVACWGADASKYVGRSLTLYGDASVKWGGMAVGGIRISHMSDIDSAMTMALTVTRANKKPFTVKPLKAASGAVSPKAAQEHGGQDQNTTASNEAPADEHAPAAALMSDDAILKIVASHVHGKDFDAALDLAGSIKDEARRLKAKERIIQSRDKEKS